MFSDHRAALGAQPTRLTYTTMNLHPVRESRTVPGGYMPNLIVNYDGSISTSPEQLVYPEAVEEIQSVLRDSARYPSPVRAIGSYHSLTPCGSSDGTILNMSRMNRTIEIDHDKRTLTAQAGLQFIDASKALRA